VGRTIPFSKDQNPRSTLCTVPCEEVFRHTNSKGTRIYRKILSRQTKFKGCQPLEEDLVEDKEVCHEMKEIIVLPQAMDNVSDGEEEYRVPDSGGGILWTRVSIAKFFLKLAISETALLTEKPVRPILPRFDEEELNITPEDLKHRHLIRLYENGKFEDKDHKNLEMVAAISIQGISDEKIISEIAPQLTRLEFLRLQGKVYRTVEETLPESTKAFIKFWRNFDTLKGKISRGGQFPTID